MTRWRGSENASNAEHETTERLVRAPGTFQLLLLIGLCPSNRRWRICRRRTREKKNFGNNVRFSLSTCYTHTHTSVRARTYGYSVYFPVYTLFIYNVSLW